LWIDWIRWPKPSDRLAALRRPASQVRAQIRIRSTSPIPSGGTRPWFRPTRATRAPLRCIRATLPGPVQRSFGVKSRHIHFIYLLFFAPSPRPLERENSHWAAEGDTGVCEGYTYSPARCPLRTTAFVVTAKCTRLTTTRSTARTIRWTTVSAAVAISTAVDTTATASSATWCARSILTERSSCFWVEAKATGLCPTDTWPASFLLLKTHTITGPTNPRRLKCIAPSRFIQR